MGNMFGMFSFSFWVISSQKCEKVNFLIFKLAGVQVRLFKYLGTSILIIAHAHVHMMCMPIMMSQVLHMMLTMSH